MRVEINDYIVADTEICNGKPTFKGTRVMVWQVLELLGAGVPIEEILDYFLVPLTKDHIQAALNYASIITSSENVVINFKKYKSQVLA
jgi:uncharacterized protein (DUF433 family)